MKRTLLCCFSMKRATLCFMLVFHFSLLHAQQSFYVPLTRKVQPKTFSAREMKFFDIPFHFRNHQGGDSTGLLQHYDLIAGDYADGNTKFTIALNHPSQDEYALYISPYQADSVIIRESINVTYTYPGKMISLKAGGKMYGAILSNDLQSVTISRLEGKYTEPDMMIYDSLLPDKGFTLLNGQKDSFSNYKHQNKYIFVVFWNTWQPGRTEDIDGLKNIYDLYKNALTVLGMHSDTMQVKQISAEKGIDWPEGRLDEGVGRYFPGGSASGGILFDANGKAIAFDLHPEQLKPLIEKLLHVN